MPVQVVFDAKMVGYLFLAASPLAAGSGCLLPTPIAVFPAPEVGSGMEVVFCDGTGQPISENGLLIVHREYAILNSVSNKVVAITNGKATIPHQWNLASLWLMPNMFSYFLIPIPHVLPGENLDIIPLIPGYNYRVSALWDVVVGKGCRIYPSQISHHLFKDGRVYLFSSACEPERGIRYLSYTFPCLRRPHEKRRSDYGLDLSLSDEDCDKVVTFISKELERLRAIQPLQSRPAADSEVESGMEITFYDGIGKPISRNGFLIVHRIAGIGPGPVCLDSRDGVVPSSAVISITNGKATIPSSLTPHLSPGSTRPVITPLVPGYNYHLANLDIAEGTEYHRIYASQIPYHRFEDGKVYLFSSANEPERGIVYLETCTLPYLRRAHEKRSSDDGPDLCLSDEDHVKVTTFIREELERLRAAQPQ